MQLLVDILNDKEIRNSINNNYYDFFANFFDIEVFKFIRYINISINDYKFEIELNPKESPIVRLCNGLNLTIDGLKTLDMEIVQDSSLEKQLSTTLVDAIYVAESPFLKYKTPILIEKFEKFKEYYIEDIKQQIGEVKYNKTVWKGRCKQLLKYICICKN